MLTNNLEEEREKKIIHFCLLVCMYLCMYVCMYGCGGAGMEGGMCCV